MDRNADLEESRKKGLAAFAEGKNPLDYGTPIESYHSDDDEIGGQPNMGLITSGQKLATDLAENTIGEMLDEDANEDDDIAASILEEMEDSDEDVY